MPLIVAGLAGVFGLFGLCAAFGVVLLMASPPPSESQTPGAVHGVATIGDSDPSGGPIGGGTSGAIDGAALSFRGTSTCGLRGAPGDAACMASVQQVVFNATGHVLGDGSNAVDDAIQSALNMGQITEIPKASTLPGDLVAVFAQDNPNAEHIGICLVAGCDSNLSNSSSICEFVWQSNDFVYAGSPYGPPHPVSLRYYRVH